MNKLRDFFSRTTDKPPEPSKLQSDQLRMAAGKLAPGGVAIVNPGDPVGNHFALYRTKDGSKFFLQSRADYEGSVRSGAEVNVNGELVNPGTLKEHPIISGLKVPAPPASTVGAQDAYVAHDVPDPAKFVVTVTAPQTRAEESAHAATSVTDIPRFTEEELKQIGTPLEDGGGAGRAAQARVKAIRDLTKYAKAGFTEANDKLNALRSALDAKTEVMVASRAALQAANRIRPGFLRKTFGIRYGVAAHEEEKLAELIGREGDAFMKLGTLANGSIVLDLGHEQSYEVRQKNIPAASEALETFRQAVENSDLGTLKPLEMMAALESAEATYKRLRSL